MLNLDVLHTYLGNSSLPPISKNGNGSKSNRAVQKGSSTLIVAVFTLLEVCKKTVVQSDTATIRDPQGSATMTSDRNTSTKLSTPVLNLPNFQEAFEKQCGK
ncbi:uncharacterized protein APUU_70748S [Aspergillus puulaauensis]|uniref:Uncharacterized protein n=1 Tax=Aspergillus puulaauensis TaxID=1220207 RepID=A0A7R7XYH7_9EURO|nr:uncharacterized protein APUU_70748S [Aspergillus puulaauensis]BCS29178.1 hypothetical protein APUU_70748S [Aspergillus puulaauensis]